MDALKGFLGIMRMDKFPNGPIKVWKKGWMKGLMKMFSDGSGMWRERRMI